MGNNNETNNDKMSARELLNWLYYYDEEDEMMEVFGEECHCAQDVFDHYDPDTVIREIMAFEEEKKIQAQIDVEWVTICRILQVKDKIKTCVYEEEISSMPELDIKTETANVLKKYISQHEGKYIAVVDEVCCPKGARWFLKK